MNPVFPFDAALAAALVLGGVLLTAAALHDVAVRTVPNWLTGALAIAGLAAQTVQGAVLGTVAVTVAAAVAVAAAVFIVAALCWRRGWMGGADVKLLGAASLLVAPAGVPALLMATALAGGALAMPYLLARRRLARPAPRKPTGLLHRFARAERWRLRRGGPMPYAVAIGFGAFFALSSQLASSYGGSP